MKFPKMHFTGFNGFRQFENCKDDCVTGFREYEPSSIMESFSDVDIEAFQICGTWSFNVIAVNSTLYLVGAVNDKTTHAKELQFPVNIKKISCNDVICLVLLVNGVVAKVCIKTLTWQTLNFLMTEKPERRRPMIDSLDDETSSSDECVTDVMCANTFSIAITNKNAVYTIPTKVHTFPKHVKVVKVCCGAEHALLLTSNGDLYSLGSSSRGQLGVGKLDTKECPTLIESLAGIKIIDIAAGAWHSGAVSAFGDLYMWGWNVNGQMGRPIYEQVEVTYSNGSSSDMISHKMPSVFVAPEIVNFAKDTADGDDSDDPDDPENQYSITNVYCGARHTLVKTECGRLFGCGWNKYGQLGFKSNDDNVVNFQLMDTARLKERSDFRVVCGSWSTILQ